MKQCPCSSVSQREENSLFKQLSAHLSAHVFVFVSFSLSFHTAWIGRYTFQVRDEIHTQAFYIKDFSSAL